MAKIAAIRVRGKIKVNPKIKDTLEYLGLKNVNNCVILEDTVPIKGMIRKVNDYITWGEIDEQTFSLLKEKRDENKKTFRLHPPRKGYERGGIRKNVKVGGALGYRGAEINNLIKKML